MPPSDELPSEAASDRSPAGEARRQGRLRRGFAWLLAAMSEALLAGAAAGADLAYRSS